jgi:hypothetical protein
MERQHPGGESKKLTGAVDHWFNGASAADADMIADAKMLGIELPPTPPQALDYAVWPENMPAVELFLRCATQWRIGEPSAVAPAGVAGLDYAVLLSIGSLYLPPDVEMRNVLEDVQVMEVRALELIYQSAKKAAEKH